MNEWFVRVHAELRAIAEHRLRAERAGHTLQATALVNEVYLKLVGDHALEGAERTRFFGAAAEAMQRILVDHARSRGREKRGGEWARVTLMELESLSVSDESGILAVHEILTQLEEQDARLATLVKLRLFAGLDENEIAAALDTSPRTVRRDWAFARAWLSSKLENR